MQLVVATAGDKRARDRLAHAAWGELLDVDGYVTREARLCAHPWARAAMTSWLWCGDDGAVCSSCETYRMASAVDGVGGESWAVASVFTEPALRRRGHARRMMDALVARARAEAAQASILFSDVGASIYEANGYRPRPAEDLLFPPAPGDPHAGVDALLSEAVEVAPLDDDFVLYPSVAQLDWHLERTRSYAALLGRPSLPAVGARVGEAVAVWSVDWKHDRLWVLAIQAGRADQAEALVRCARRTAWALQLREVRLWAQPWPFAGRADLGGDRVARVGSLPMIAPLSPSLRPAMWVQISRAVWV